MSPSNPGRVRSPGTRGRFTPFRGHHLYAFANQSNDDSGVTSRIEWGGKPLLDQPGWAGGPSQVPKYYTGGPNGGSFNIDARP